PASPTWVNVSPPLNQPFDVIRVDPSNPKLIYAGSDTGLWHSVDCAATWSMTVRKQDCRMLRSMMLRSIPKQALPSCSPTAGARMRSEFLRGLRSLHGPGLRPSRRYRAPSDPRRTKKCISTRTAWSLGLLARCPAADDSGGRLVVIAIRSHEVPVNVTTL